MRRAWPLGLVILVIAAAVASRSGTQDDPSPLDTTASETSEAGGPQDTTTSPDTPTGSSGSALDTTATPTTDTDRSKGTRAEPSEGRRPSGRLPLNDGDWTLESVRIDDDGRGNFGGVARITYAGGSPEGARNTFTITVFERGDAVASLQGIAEHVAPGETVTVRLSSPDDYEQGDFQYQFQADL